MIEHQETCILLFVKYPEKGNVKLRLSKNMDEDIVVELYRCFVQDTLTTVQTSKYPFFIFFHPPDSQRKFEKWLGPTFLFLPQKGKNLGERMKNSFTDVFTKGYRKAILMGSDSPDLPQKYLTQAVDILKTKDVVLGPTVDGGYYLIGFNSTTFLSNVFEEIPWSTPHVFQETITKIQQATHSVGLLPVWSDIDTISDLKNLIKRTQNTSFITSNTMTYIHQHHISMESDEKDESGTKSRKRVTQR
jgi:rSAM/selenodomain-associated transferase 1